VGALLAAGVVRVNGRRARKGTMVHAGDAVTVADGPPVDSAASVTSALRLPPVHEDADLVAVDKPPGVPTTIGNTAGPSVAAALLARFPEMGVIDPRRAAGLVHRLDTGTSGLLIAARSPTTYARLRREFAAKAIEKEYVAVVRGRLDRPHIVAEPLARHPRRRNRMIVARPDRPGWTARTDVVPLRADDDLSVVRLIMRTGVTHQLRLHLSLLGHPVMGDRRYGDAALESQVGVEWHYLHARALRFDAPDLPRGLAAPFPEHWRALFATRAWPIETIDG
jgi:23S rRNA pseudouridine1911/1915/1917 synthase